MNANTLTVACEKGGVGKTTTAINLAPLFVKNLDFKVLMIDLDNQANLTRSLTGEDRSSWENNGLYELVYEMLQKNADPHKFVSHTNYSGIDLIPANTKTQKIDARLEEYSSVCGMPPYVFIKEAIKTLSEDYDLIIVDTPTNKGTMLLSGLYMSNEVLIPCKADAHSFNGVISIFTMLDDLKRENPNDFDSSVVGIVQTIVEKVAITQLVREEYLKANYPAFLLETMIRKANAVNESTFSDTIPSISSQNSNVKKDYEALYSEIASIMNLVKKAGK